MTDELTKMIEAASRRAEKCFRKHGHVMTQYCALDGEGSWFAIPTPATSAEEKEFNAMMVRALFEEQRVQRYIYVAECWTLDEKAPGWDSLEFHPRRREAIVFMAEDRTSGQMFGIRYIDRNGKRPKLTPLEVDRPDTIGGRMASMLTPMKAHKRGSDAMPIDVKSEEFKEALEEYGERYFDAERYGALYRSIRNIVKGEPIPRCLSALINNAIDVARFGTEPTIQPSRLKEILTSVIDQLIDYQSEHGQWSIDEPEGTA
jgi:hypothetical protein